MRSMRYSFIATAACIARAGPALSHQETFHPDEQVAKELAEAEVEMRDTKEAQCMKAVGAKEFCSCIADESPEGIDFVDYVRIVLDESAPLSAGDRASVDASMNKCVSLAAVSCK
jgi:hypothetical protein